MNTARVLKMEDRSLPQLEDGYIRIANELYDAILKFGFTGRQIHVLLAVARKTYGYGKRIDDVSASQLGELCGMSRPHVTSTLNQLAEMSVISKRPGTYGSVVSINKDYKAWSFIEKHRVIASTESVQGVPIQSFASTESVQVGSTESVHTKDNFPKDNKQKTTLKDIPAPQAAGAPESEARVAKSKDKAAMTTELQDRFNRFYAAYPRKTDRKDAEKAFAKLNPDEDVLALMLDAIERGVAAGLYTDRTYVKHPATWLNKGSWLDEIESSYTADEIEVIEAYNDALGDSLGVIDISIYTMSRAGQIKDFMTLSHKPRFWSAFFPWVRDNCDLPPRVGFDWLISREGFSKVKGGQHQRAV